MTCRSTDIKVRCELFNKAGQYPQTIFFVFDNDCSYSHDLFIYYRERQMDHSSTVLWVQFCFINYFQCYFIFLQAVDRMDPVHGNTIAHRSMAFFNGMMIFPGGIDANSIVFDKTIYMITRDRKSTRLNSSHSQISYAVFCL